MDNKIPSSEMADIRRLNLRLWFSDKSIPAVDRSFISQLMRNGKSFGEKAARRLEMSHNMPSGYLDSRINLDLSNIDAAHHSLEAKKPDQPSSLGGLPQLELKKNLDTCLSLLESALKLVEERKVVPAKDYEFLLGVWVGEAKSFIKLTKPT